MKKIISMTVLAVLLSSATVAQGQAVTGWERKVYYQMVDRMASVPKGASKDEQNRAVRETAREYGLTVGELNDIGERVWDQDLTDHEWQIADEVEDRFSALPRGYTKAESARVYREIASKYGISINVLYDIDMRAMM